MANNKGRGQKAAKKNYYNSYNPEAQRKIRLERHLKNHPNDDQAKAAKKNPQARGPKPSKEVLGWVDRFETVDGMFIDSKKDQGHLYADLRGKKDAKDRSWMASVIRKAERQRQHELNFGKKAGKQKG